MSSLDRKYSLRLLAWPIFIEIFLQTMLGSVDTIMVSRISDDAVAIVGFSVQVLNALMTLFMTIAGGAGILIAQKIGAKKPNEARSVALMSVCLNVLIGLLVSLFLFTQAVPVGKLLHVSDNLLPAWKTYLSNVGAGMFLVAMMTALSTSIRNTGNTKGPMYVGIGINALHILLNYGFIFGKLGLPEWGLQGVSISDNVSRLVAVSVLLYIFRNAFETKIKWSDFLSFDLAIFKQIFRIGWPLGVNSFSWFFSQLVIYSFLAQLGAQALAARTYMNTLESYCFTLGFALALAGQIQIAHLYGAGRTKDAYLSAYRAMFIGFAVVILNAFLLFLAGRRLLGFFTHDPHIIALGVSLLGLNLLLQPAKMLNMAIGNALSAVGDTRFTMCISLISMFTIANGCAYWLGIVNGWGLIGIYCCMITDELVRGVIVLFRWRGRKYLKKAESKTPRPFPTEGAATILSH